MHPTSLAIYQFWQCIYIGAKQFLHTTIFQYLAHHWVLRSQSLQCLLVGHILSTLCLAWFIADFQHIKQQFSHLFRRTNVKIRTRYFAYMTLYALHFGCHHARRLRQCKVVYYHTCTLHLSQHSHKRHLHFIKQLLQSHLLYLWLQHTTQSQRNIGILRRIIGYLIQRHIAHRPLILTLRAYQLIDMYCLVFQQYLCQVVHTMTQLWLQQIVRYHRVK